MIKVLKEVEERGQSLVTLLTKRGREILDMFVDDKMRMEDQFVFHTALYDAEEGADGYTNSHQEDNSAAKEDYPPV